MPPDDTDDTVKITLTLHEYFIAASAGMMRMHVSSAAGRNCNTGNVSRPPLTRTGDEIRSMCAEYAWAKASGTFFDGGVNKFMSEPDTNGVEHKTLRDRNGRMPIRPTDKQERVFVCSFTDGQTVTFLGWIRGTDKRDEWKSNPGNARPAWFVPQSALRPISELPPDLLPVAFNPERN